jgi:antitoxin component of RelBE/YafQ-DinJ toxin-antitoxin module
MDTIVRIDASSKAAKSFLAFVKNLSFAKVEKEFNRETLKALEDVRKGKTFKVKNSEELFKKLGI